MGTDMHCSRRRRLLLLAEQCFPTIEQYAAVQAKIAEAGALLNQDPLSEENAERVREDLRAALELNGREPAALLTASAYNEKRKDYAAAARFRSTLVEVRPLESSAYAGLGHVLLLGGEYAKAEEALKRAVELETMTPQIAEDLGASARWRKRMTKVRCRIWRKR